jgi:hypothetical protein
MFLGTGKCRFLKIFPLIPGKKGEDKKLTPGEMNIGLGCEEKTMLLNTSFLRLLVLAALILALLAGGAPAQKAASPEAAALRDIKVSFKLDPLITKALYMGDRWVSPPTFMAVQDGQKPLTIEAKALGLDAQGKETKISPAWTPADPGMVQVSPGQGHQVEITVRRAGQSTLKVDFQGISKTLSVQAKPLGNVLVVEISQ